MKQKATWPALVAIMAVACTVGDTCGSGGPTTSPPQGSGSVNPGGSTNTGGVAVETGGSTYAQGCDGTQLLPVPDDPGQRGPWKVGLRTVKIGRLDVDVLYPAMPGSDAGLPVATVNLRDWLPEREQRKIADSASPDVTVLGGDMFRGVPIDDGHGPYPVIVMVHGTSSMRIASMSTMAHWASRGFIVSGADYPGLMLADQLAATLECSLPQSGSQDILGDVNLQMNAMKNPSGDVAFLAGSVDASRAGLAGHSQGGCIVATLPNSVSNVQVVVAMSASTTTSDAPNLHSLMYIGGLNDAVIGYQSAAIGNAVCPANPFPATSVRDAYTSSPGPPAVKKRLVGITGGGHLVPTDLCQTNDLGNNAIQQAQIDGVCGINTAVIIGLPFLFDCGTIDRVQGIEAVNYATTAQLEETLHCKDHTAAFQMMRTKLPQIGDFQESL